MRVLGEQQAAEIIALLNRDEVEKLGTAMVDVGDVTQDAVDGVLDDVMAQLRGQTNLGLGSKDYVEGVLRRALGPDKSASVLVVFCRLRLVRARDLGMDDAAEYL